MTSAKQLRRTFQEMPPCDQAPDGGGHHFTPHWTGHKTDSGEEVYEQVCRYCGRTLTS